MDLLSLMISDNIPLQDSHCAKIYDMHNTVHRCCTDLKHSLARRTTKCLHTRDLSGTHKCFQYLVLPLLRLVSESTANHQLRNLTVNIIAVFIQYIHAITVVVALAIIRLVVTENVFYRKVVDKEFNVKSLAQVCIIDQASKHYRCLVLFLIRVLAKIT